MREHPNTNCNHNGLCRVRFALLLAAIIGTRAAAVQGFAQAQDVEAHVRERITAYWQAMEKTDYATASQYVHPDSRRLFDHNLPKSRILKWQVMALSFDKTYTSCDAVVLVTRPFPFYGTNIDLSLRNHWVLYEGDWYFKLPWKEGENPMLEVFRGQQATEQALADSGLQRNAPSQGAGSKPGPAGMEGLQRIVPDPTNPAAVHFGEKVTFRFSYRNSGNVPFRIVSATADCHCTSIGKEYPELAPGQTATLEVLLDTFGLPLGQIEKDIMVQFSDLPSPVVVRLAVANLPNFAVAPQSVDFGPVDKGKAVEMAVRLTNQSGRRVQIVSFLKSDPKLELSLTKTSLEPGEELLLSFKYNAGSEGEFFDNLMLRTDLPAEPLVNIPIRGRVKP